MDGQTYQAPPKKRSKLMTLLYIIIGLVLVTIALELFGADVVGTRETDTMIERPHAGER